MMRIGRDAKVCWFVAGVSLVAIGCGGGDSSTPQQPGIPPAGVFNPGPTLPGGQTTPTTPGAAPTSTAGATGPVATSMPTTPTATPGTAPPAMPTTDPTGATGPVAMPTSMPTGAPTTTPTSAPTTVPPNTPTVVCGNTHGQYEGDEYCIEPPPPDQGFQLHYGPTDYDDPTEVAKYIIPPGGETNIYVPATSGNTQDIYYYKRQYRMRPGSHHMIISEGGGTNPFAAGRRLGGSQNVSRDNPEGTPAPENAGIGIPLKANDPLSINLHHWNGTDHPLLKEAWINFWYVDPSTVTQRANELYLFAPGSSVPPGGHTVFTGTHTVTAAGRILSMYGHRHASTVRFSAYRTRGGNKMLIYQDFDWEEPSVFEFNSTTQNPPPDPNTKVAGAYSGDLDLQPGDVLSWECEVQNTQNVTITYGQNEALNSEMCILIGDVIGPEIIAFFTNT